MQSTELNIGKFSLDSETSLGGKQGQHTEFAGVRIVNLRGGSVVKNDSISM